MLKQTVDDPLLDGGDSPEAVKSIPEMAKLLSKQEQLTEQMRERNRMNERHGPETLSRVIKLIKIPLPFLSQIIEQAAREGKYTESDIQLFMEETDLLSKGFRKGKKVNR